ILSYFLNQYANNIFSAKKAITVAHAMPCSPQYLTKRKLKITLIASSKRAALLSQLSRCLARIMAFVSINWLMINSKYALKIGAAGANSSEKTQMNKGSATTINIRLIGYKKTAMRRV